MQDERVHKLQRLTELQTSVKTLKSKIQHLADNDPEILERLGASTTHTLSLHARSMLRRRVAGAHRLLSLALAHRSERRPSRQARRRSLDWCVSCRLRSSPLDASHLSWLCCVDNVFTMRSWVAQKRGCASSEVRTRHVCLPLQTISALLSASVKDSHCRSWCCVRWTSGSGSKTTLTTSSSAAQLPLARLRMLLNRASLSRLPLKDLFMKVHATRTRERLRFANKRRRATREHSDATARFEALGADHVLQHRSSRSEL